MVTICDKCRKYSISECGTNETCEAFIDEMTKFKYGITKPYIELRMTGEKRHCKEFKKLHHVR